MAGWGFTIAIILPQGQLNGKRYRGGASNAKKYLFLFILWVAIMFVFNYLREGIPELFWMWGILYLLVTVIMIAYVFKKGKK